MSLRGLGPLRTRAGRSRYDRASGVRVGQVVAVLALALSSRLVELTDESLWLDEVTTITARANLPIPDLLATTIQQTPHPPLYFVLLHHWFELAGASARSARLFSVLVGVGAVALTYLVGRRLVGHTSGLAAALFLAASPFHVQYSREARMYALLSLLALASFYGFVRLVEDGRSGSRPRTTAVGYVVATTLLLYTHLYGLFVVAAQGAYVAIEALRGGPGLDDVQSRAISCLAATLGLFTPWSYLLWRSVGADATGGGSRLVDWISAPTPALLSETFLTYAGYVSNYPYDDYAGYTLAVAHVLLAGFVVLSWLAFLGYREELFSYGLGEYLRRYRLVLVWLVCGCLLPYLVSATVVPIFHPRFTIVALPAVYLLVGWGVSSISPARLRRTVGLVLVLGLLTSSVVYHATPTDEQWREAGAYVDANARPDAVVFVAPPFLDRPVEYYLDRPSVRVAPLPSDAAERVRSNHRGRFWIVTSGAHDGADEALAEVDGSHERLASETFGEVRVSLYRVAGA